MKYCFWGLALCLFVACQNEPAPVEEDTVIDLETLLPGTWETIDIKMVLNTVNGQDSINFVHIAEGQWGKKIGMNPPRIYYLNDNKYRKERITADGQIIETHRGIWNTFGDTLMMIEPDATYQYIVKANDQGLTEYRSLEDLDGDGEVDDEYVGVQRLVSRSVKAEEQQ